jgi:hypothetical protein
MRSAALMMLLVFGAAPAFLIKGSMPVFRAFRLRFFTIPLWNPVAHAGLASLCPSRSKGDSCQETVGNLASAGLVPDRRLDACMLAAEHDLSLASSRRKAS